MKQQAKTRAKPIAMRDNGPARQPDDLAPRSSDAMAASGTSSGTSSLQSENMQPESFNPESGKSDTGNGMVQKATGVAYETADTVVQAAVEGASSISQQIGHMLNEQVAAGADMMAQVANSSRLAADDLGATMPQIGQVVHRVADQIDTFSDRLKEQSVQQLSSSASDLARRQPALVFGLAALAGFIVFRAFSVAPKSQMAGSSRDEA
jgi:ElaB/YqjD/DUF883 family membrane-anchored ribosome-binding protein